jgi:hypothetical protein
MFGFVTGFIDGFVFRMEFGSWEVWETDETGN